MASFPANSEQIYVINEDDGIEEVQRIQYYEHLDQTPKYSIDNKAAPSNFLERLEFTNLNQLDMEHVVTPLRKPEQITMKPSNEREPQSTCKGM